MLESHVRKNAFSMPFSSPAFTCGPYRFINREYLVVSYETDIDALREIVPEPLEVRDPIVNFEFMRMPDSTGFGDYTEAGQVIPVHYDGKQGNYVHAMYLDSEAPIAGGREIWGFPKKLGSPVLVVAGDTLLGTLDYGPVRLATATMGFKHSATDPAVLQQALSAPNYLLKVIPHVDGSPRICELVEYHTTEVTVKGSWTGPAALDLHPHALAPVTRLPVRRVVSAQHFVTDLTLALGTVVHEY
ncbi:acetoacetate decarboxylase [Variovorax sp. UC122_21]|uniref:acetoacetate decarboxylase n=1 Tax=Variovorax sp. UC122_21 TaxID=3374554 RepID=UPI003756B7CD